MPSHSTISSLENNDGLAEILSLHDGTVKNLLKKRLLNPQSVDIMLDTIKKRWLPSDSLISTDDNLFLEYSTPRGNVRAYGKSLRENIRFLSKFSPPSFLEGTLLK
jgi:spermidine synthase